MKINKVLSFALIAAVSLTLISGSAFAWYTFKNTSSEVSIKAGDLEDFNFEFGKGFSKEGSSLLFNSKNPILSYPGQSFKVDQGRLVKNTTRIGLILQVSFDDHFNKSLVEATLKTEPSSEFINDYEKVGDVWKIKSDRMHKLLSLDIPKDPTSNHSTGFIEEKGKYYTYVKPGESVLLDVVSGIFTGELGGGSLVNDQLTPARPFEQQSSFNIKYRIAVVQNSYLAVAEEMDLDVAEYIKQNHPTWLKN